MWQRITRVTPLSQADALSVLSLEDAKEHLRFEDDDQDSTIKGYIEAAAAKIDGPDGFGVSLLPTQWRLSMDRLPPAFAFPLGPVTSLDSITHRGELIAPAAYQYDVDAEPLLVRPVTAWDVDNAPKAGAVKILVTAGYVSPPADLVQLMRWLVGHYFENREAVTVGVEALPLPMAADSVIAKYMRGVAA